MKEAKFYYSAGFFITVSFESQLLVAKHAAETNKFFMTNFSATFIPQFYKKELLQLLPYVDIIFGNNDEILAFGKEMKYETTDIEELAKIVSTYEKINKKKR